MSGLQSETVSGELYQYYPLGTHVVRAIGVCGGRPTFKYTRIEVSGALERIAAGESVQQLAQGYQGRVSEEAIREAIHLAAVRFAETANELEPIS